MKKVSVISPANIGLIKYWGFHDETLYIPNNDNIAVTMSNCLTTTTVKVSEEYGEDSIAFASQDGECMLTDKSTMKSKKAYELVEYVRKRAGSSLKAKIVSHNTFPSDAGIAASASSFSALTLGLLHAYELNDVLGDAQEISRIARRSGSASAARSIMGGFVKLKAGGDDQHSFAVQIADEHHWDIVDVVAVVDDGKKILSTSEGHMRAKTNPYFHTRLEEMQPRIQRVRQAIVEKNIQLLGEAIEQEALSMHAITMTSQPPALYFQPGTIALIKNIMRWREQGDVQSYFTIDAGPNVHIIAEASELKKLEDALSKDSFVKYHIVNHPCEGAKVIHDHLF